MVSDEVRGGVGAVCYELPCKLYAASSVEEHYMQIRFMQYKNGYFLSCFLMCANPGKNRLMNPSVGGAVTLRVQVTCSSNRSVWWLRSIVVARRACHAQVYENLG